jgi:conjugal transfer mating pair stabilization protein TraN
MKEACKAGKDFAKMEASQAHGYTKQISAEDLTPEYDKKKKFREEKVKKDIKNGQAPKSEIRKFLLSSEVKANERNKHFHPDELFLQESEKKSQNFKDEVEVVQKGEYSWHKCKLAGEPAVLTLTRTLKVKVNHQPEVRQQVKACKGHEDKEKFFWKSDAEHAVAKHKKKLAQDSTIKSYDVWIDDGGVFKDYVVRLKWKHVYDCPSCHHYKMKTKVTQKETVEEGKEEWVYDNPALVELSKQPDCTLIEQVCLDSQTTKVIKGKEVTRKCWKERLSYLYEFPPTRECSVLKEKGCEEVSRRCIKESPFGCAQWEVTFKCLSNIKKNQVIEDSTEIFGLASEEISYEPNRSFSEVATKLSIFKEIKGEIEKTNAMDASKVQVFKGQKMKCTKNVADGVLYDCCFKYSGLAKQAGLTKCNADELALADRREKGLCHYVGSYEEKFLELWKSRDVHVFCCYPTKLARVAQEEARKQLKLGWGTPEEPRCGGLSLEEMAKLDFSKMDVREIVDQMPATLPDNFQSKLEGFQKRLKEEVAKEELK